MRSEAERAPQLCPLDIIQQAEVHLCPHAREASSRVHLKKRYSSGSKVQVELTKVVEVQGRARAEEGRLCLLARHVSSRVYFKRRYSSGSEVEVS